MKTKKYIRKMLVSLLFQIENGEFVVNSFEKTNELSPQEWFDGIPLQRNINLTEIRITGFPVMKEEKSK